MSRTIGGTFHLLREKLRDPLVRRNAGSLLAGKMIGLGIVLLIISKWYLPATAYADATPALPSPEINAINTVWTLVAAYLVFCMQVGFVMLEAGVSRSPAAVHSPVGGNAGTRVCGITLRR